MILAAKLAVPFVTRLGTKLAVVSGLIVIAGAMVLVTGFGVDTGDFDVCLALGLMGFGIGLAIAPATESIMGSLPKAKAGIGSAMNDVVREVGGTLGIAVLGSVLSSVYASSLTGVPEAAEDSVGAAHAMGIIEPANQAFVDAMSTTASVAALFAVAGALIALCWLPSRARVQNAPDGLGARAVPELG